MRRRDSRIDLALNLCIESKEDLTVGQMALATGLSRSRFSELFYLQTGMLPREFLRLMKAFHHEHRHAVRILVEAGYRLQIQENRSAAAFELNV